MTITQRTVHLHQETVTCPQNCPGRNTDRDTGHHEYTPPQQMFTCAHPEDAKNCVTESNGTPTHAHLCDDCVPVDETLNVGPRRLSDIARDIRATWPKVSPHAQPYLDAMAYLDSITDVRDYEDGQGVVLYFLSNANTWRGDDARRIKAELRTMLDASTTNIKRWVQVNDLDRTD